MEIILAGSTDPPAPPYSAALYWASETPRTDEAARREVPIRPSPPPRTAPTLTPLPR